MSSVGDVVTFGVLGPITVVGDDGEEIALAGERQRRLLSALILHRGRVVSIDRLTELVWGAETVVDPAALQSLVFRLRQRFKNLDLEYRAPGYVLRCDDHDVDVGQFEALVLEAVTRRDEDPERGSELLDEALRLWRGAPFEDLVDSDDGRIEINRLKELRSRANEEQFEMRLAVGAASDVIAELDAFAAREPLRERPRYLLMGALESLGRRAEALRVYDAYRRLLADELGVAPSPELRRRHDELLAADEVTLPSGDVERRRSRPLRRPSSSFVGREALVVETIDHLSHARLVTLIGPGGVGKTRLATEVAHLLGPTAIDGVIWCDLTMATGRTVIDVVISAAAVESRAGQPDLDRLVEVLRHERWCVVLDNCEHVIDEAAVVAERLVEMTTDVMVLATSRERLAVDGECLVNVLPLDREGGSDSPATRLLVDRMRAVTGRVAGDDELRQLDELAGRLDGLPLALELAAARMQTLTPREVLDGVEESIAVLRGGRRTVERHRSVDAALQWSYELLDEPARATLRAAATFASPFGADDVAALMEVDHATVVDLLSTLIERSMAHRDGSRLYLLHVVRRFAAERTDDVERDRLAVRLSSRMCDVAERLREALRNSNNGAPIDEYLVRLRDFGRAIEMGLASGDVETPLRTVVALRDLAFNSSTSEIARWSEEVAAAGDAVDHPLTVDAYAIAGLGAWKRGALDDSRRVLALAEGFVERHRLAPTYELLGAQATEDLAHGELARAIERLELATQLPGVLDDPIRRAETIGTLVICMAYAHRLGALDVADGLLADLADGPAVIADAWCRFASGECRLETDPLLARRHLEQAVALARAGGSTFVEGIAGASLASLDVRTNDIAAAVDNYRWLLSLWLRAGLQTPFWTGMRSVAELLMRAGEAVAAVRLLGAVMALGTGHDVYGDDATRLASMCRDLEERVGGEVFAAEFARGAGLDEAAAAHEAATAFDRMSATAR